MRVKKAVLLTLVSYVVGSVILAICSILNASEVGAKNSNILLEIMLSPIQVVFLHYDFFIRSEGKLMDSIGVFYVGFFFSILSGGILLRAKRRG